MPHNPNIIWAGTEIGLFVSNNNGETWEIANNGLPAVSIWEMKVRGEQIVMATHGRGIWTVDLPQLANTIKAPTLTAAGTSPSNKTAIQFITASTYDSLSMIIDNKTYPTSLSTFNRSETITIINDYGLSNGEHTIQLIAYQNGFSLKSNDLSFIKTTYTPAMTNYENNFDATSNDFEGNGFQIESYATLGQSMAIHSNHPYLNNQTITYTLKTPIILQKPSVAEATTLLYKDIPMVEEGEVDAKFGTVEFYDYVVVEGSKNGVDWIPLLDGYDFSLISATAAKFGRTVESEPNSQLFTEHNINLLQKFVDNDTILIRFKLYADQNDNGWGWVIDDVLIQSNDRSTKAQVPFADLSIYPNPCNNELMVKFGKHLDINVCLTIYDMHGKTRMINNYSSSSNILLNTSQLNSGNYLLKIEDGKNHQHIKFQVVR